MDLLLRRFALGEIDAFETLVQQFQGDVYAWTVRIVRDPGIAEDLTVETLWHIHRARRQFRPDGNFAAWARRIATNWHSTISGTNARNRTCSQNPPERLHQNISSSRRRGRRSSRHFAACRRSCKWRRRLHSWKNSPMPKLPMP